MNELITKLNIRDLVPELETGKLVFFCGPGITGDIGNALYEIAAMNISIFIVCDLDAQNDYRGLNEIESINKLFALPSVKIKSSKGINVSFITNFTTCNYYLFPVSKILKNDPEGYNAVMFSGLDATTLFGRFFPEIVNKNPEAFLKMIKNQRRKENNKLSDAIEDDQDTVDSILGEKLTSEFVTTTQVEEIRKQVKDNPPEKPDLQRKVNFINTYIQIVDLKFEGANWQSKRITIPQKLIPFKSEALQKNLDSKLKIFSKVDEDKSLTEFNTLKKKVDELRKEYLFRSKLRKKSIIKSNDKNDFKVKFDELKAEVQTFKDTLFTLVKTQIDVSRERIRTELIDFYRENPNENMKTYKTNLEAMIADEVDSLLNKIQFPRVHDIVGELDLTSYVLNFTYEDFEDLKFLEELAGWVKLSREEYFKLFDKQKAFQTLGNK